MNSSLILSNVLHPPVSCFFIGLIAAVLASFFLARLNIDFGGHLVATLALMELPVIIVGLLLVRIFANRRSNNNGDREPEAFNWREVQRESCLNGSVFLLVGSLRVGLDSSQQRWESLKPFTGEMFYGV